jgi:hypothetical protein
MWYQSWKQSVSIIGHVVHSLCATKIVHDCMASLSPVGIASLFHHHCCMILFVWLFSRVPEETTRWNYVIPVRHVFFPWNLRVFKKISCYVFSCPQYVINADTVMEINSLCFKNRVHSPDENVLVLMCFWGKFPVILFIASLYLTMNLHIID